MSLKTVGLLLAAASLVLSLSVSATSQENQARRYGDVLIEVEAPPPGNAEHGYSEFRVTISSSSSKPHSVTLSLPDSTSSSMATRSTRVEPGATVTASLFLPALPVPGGFGLAVTIDGAGQPPFPVNLPNVFSGVPSILFSQSALADTFQKRIESALKPSGSSSSGSPSFTAINSTTPPSGWSPNWLGYSRYDGIVLSGADMLSLPPAVAAAIQSYVECGGVLLVLGEWQMPETWRLRPEPGLAIPTYEMGFGQCKLLSESKSINATSLEFAEIKEAWIASRTPWESTRLHDPRGANMLFPVVDNLSIPIRGLLLMMLLFVILIGPVNLTLLSRKRKKLWLLWTVPAISLVTCIAVSAYSVFKEGLTGSSRTEVLTVLDEESHRAATIGMIAYYSPLTPGGGLHFSTDTELTAQTGSLYYYRSGSGGPLRSIDWTQDQHLVSGWISARIPSHFLVRRTEMRRERLGVRRQADGSLEITNGLGANIKELSLLDNDRRFFHSTGIPAGASLRLNRAPDPAGAVSAPHHLRRMFASDWPSINNNMVSNATSVLKPGSYLASLDGAPFIEEGLGGVKKRSWGLVYGLMKGIE